MAEINTEFDLTTAAGYRADIVSPSMKSLLSVIAASRGNAHRVMVSDLHVKEGWNLREANSLDLAAYIRELADKIKANGFYDHKPIHAVPGFIKKKPVLYVHDGHCRLAAVKIAIEEGAPIEDLPVVIKEPGADEASLTVSMINSNDGRPLSPLGRAMGCARLRAFGWDEAQIAKSLSRTEDYVRKLLVLASAPLPIRELVRDERVSAALATQALARHGDDALAELLAGLDRAGAAGKKKLTAKHLPEKARKKALAAAAPKMVDVLRKVQADKTFAALPSELQELVGQLLSGIPDEVNADAGATAVDPRQMKLISEEVANEVAK